MLVEKSESSTPFPVVGIGASAGGIGALETFFENVPADIGMAFVIILHLDPTRESIVSSMIQKHSRINVQDITSGMAISANNAYMLPPGNNVGLENGRLVLDKPEAPRGLRMPVDFFFHSLAADQHENAVGILLSGTGTDGTLGMKHIKAIGGIVMVQDPQSTEYPGMAQSAISSIDIDYIATPEKLPALLMNHHLVAAKGMRIKDNYSLDKIQSLLDQICEIVREQMGQDISIYKQSTVLRRLDRRMTVNKVTTLEEYIDLLGKNRAEVDSLFHEVLIGVTHFFRDDDAFKTLEEKVISPLFENRGDEDPIRVWVAGCSTGEEAYSIVILLEEHNMKSNKHVKIQVFATDIDTKAIEKARAGIYPENIAANLTPDIRDRYFIKQENMYRVKKLIRGMVVFAQQNTLSDPPFSNIDLISCRNLLIYLRPEVQKRLFQIFHYALKIGGFLFLGTSEMILNFGDMLENIDKKSRIFKKKQHASHAARTITPYPPFMNFSVKTRTDGPGKKLPPSYRELVESLMLGYYCPSAAIVNQNNEVLYIHGRTGKYLEPASGAAAMNIIEMARDGLKIELATAIRKATSTNMIARFENLNVRSNGDITNINLIVHPVLKPDEMRGLLLIVFEDKGRTGQIDNGGNVIQPVEDMNLLRNAHLETELASLKQYLQTAVDELQTSNEELKSTNEELQSSNEELKSTNEELQTSQEELQSLNEELLTLNNELESKNTDLSKTNDDLNNLISSTGIATLFLDMKLHLTRFTPRALEIFNLIPGDVGRPFTHVSSNLDYKEYIQDIKDVLLNLVPVERDVSVALQNKWYTMRIIPYRTEENVITGVVMTFFDITMKKHVERDLQDSREQYQISFTNAEFLKSLLLHDINNVLTVIGLVTASLVFPEHHVDEKIQTANARIQEEVQRGASLVHRVRKIVKMQEIDTKIIPVRIVDVIHEIVSYIQRSYLTERIEFKLNADGMEGTMVMGNEYLGDALENIITNGIKYNTSEVKTIRIDVVEERMADSHRVRVSISDNGVGMHENVKNSIMDGTFKRNGDGTAGLGIGLSIVKQIITRVDGKLVIEDRIQENCSNGTIIHILLRKAI